MVLSTLPAFVESVQGCLADREWRVVQRASIEEAEPLLSPEQEAILRRRQEQQEREERALKLVYDKYMEARAKCGQTAELSFDTVRNALRQQVRQIKSQYQVETVKFRITVEDGKAKVKAVPVTEEKK